MPAAASKKRCDRGDGFQTWEETDGVTVLSPDAVTTLGLRRGAITVDWNGGLTGPQSKPSGFEVFNGGCVNPRACFSSEDVKCARAPSRAPSALQTLFDQLNAPFLEGGDAPAPDYMRRDVGAPAADAPAARACWQTLPDNRSPCATGPIAAPAPHCK